jgi:hypothetical protein
VVVEWIGWAATAVFAASYFCRDPARLRRWQAGAAFLWVGYGVFIHAAPVVVANVVVAAVALGSTLVRSRPAEKPEAAGGAAQGGS